MIFSSLSDCRRRTGAATTEQDVAQPCYPDSDGETDDLWNITEPNYGSTFSFIFP